MLLLTAACLGWVLHGLDWSVVGESLWAFDWVTVVPIVALYFVTQLLRAQRFRILLPVHLGFRDSLAVLSVGYLALHVIPLRMGELVRPYLARERYGIPFGDSLAVVVIERLLDVLLLLAMLGAVAFFVDLPASIVVQGIDVLAVGQRLAGGIVAAGVVGIVVVVAVGEPVLRLTDRLPMGAMARRFRDAIRGLGSRPAVGAQAFVLTVLTWLITIVAVYVQLAGFPGLEARWDIALTTWAATLAGMAAIPTPGFFGGFEASCAAALQLFEIEPSVARTFAILLHLIQFGFTIVTGLIFVAWEGLSLREIVAKSQQASAAG